MITFTIVADADHDNMSEAAESCLAGAQPPNTPPDSDASNAYKDFDLDGIPNADDLALTGEPCVAATSYTANFRIEPNPVPIVGVDGQKVTAYLTIPYRSTSAVNGSTVRISRIAGRQVSGFGNVGWSVDKKGVGIAKFDRMALINYLAGEGLLRRQILVEITGTSSSDSWSFSGLAPINTQ